jgi:outer membrane protein
VTRHLSEGRLVWVVSALLLAGSIAAPAMAWADIKMGFIDSDRIFAEYSKTREAQDSFNREVSELSKTAREKKNEIDVLQKKLDQQGPMLSDAKREEQNIELQRKIGEYESFVQTNWGPGGRITKLNEEYLKPIVDRVHAIVADIGTQEGYSLILDAADGNVVFGDKTLDLTDRVLTALKEEDQGTRHTPPRSTGSTTSTGNNSGTGSNPTQQ